MPEPRKSVRPVRRALRKVGLIRKPLFREQVNKDLLALKKASDKVTAASAGSDSKYRAAVMWKEGADLDYFLSSKRRQRGLEGKLRVANDPAAYLRLERLRKSSRAKK